MIDFSRNKEAGHTPVMQHASLSAFISKAPTVLKPKGPFAIVLLEDAVEVDSTIDHCHSLGFSEVLVFGNRDLLPEDRGAAHLVAQDMHASNAMPEVVNAVIEACPGQWLHYCYNSEYLYFPFCETRNVKELVTFNTEERRDTIMTYVIDLYSKDLGKYSNAVSVDEAYFDKAGYYALQRFTQDGHALERQLDFFGGLRWRYEEHVPWLKRRIDRVSLFRAYKGLTLSGNHTFNDEEYNTYSCPWHHNISATVCSFRTAKALMSNPGSMYAIPHFWWKGSERFEWNSNQLMQLGLMEPGQWF
ncbi:hypothetical protein [uncultured Litoreibacter sp.]|uniref:hypothetical protein n=1 Tax=uncultured Litoreibacter sp. TaxID=1392394 RepID=UPI003457EB8C